jgi:hypothetical protein
MRNLPETPIIFLVYSPKCYFFSFFGVILIAISEINYIKQCTDRNYVHKHAYRGSDWSLRTSCGSWPWPASSCSYVKPVVTRGSTVSAELYQINKMVLSRSDTTITHKSSGADGCYVIVVFWWDKNHFILSIKNTRYLLLKSISQARQRVYCAVRTESWNKIPS